jgi:hypothetical protein
VDIITIDFETYYDRDYSLSKLTTEAYIRDPRFEIIGVGIKVNDTEKLTGTPALTRRGFSTPSTTPTQRSCATTQPSTGRSCLGTVVSSPSCGSTR